jgi:hypothetical protein
MIKNFIKTIKQTPTFYKYFCVFILVLLFGILSRSIFIIVTTIAVGFTCILYTLNKWSNTTNAILEELPVEEDYVLYSDNGLYRLGDMVLTDWRFEPDGQEYHFKHFPDSIASEYMRTTNLNSNYDVLSNIVKKRSAANDIPDNNTLVIHLRTGDVVEDSPYSVATLLKNCVYVPTYDYGKIVEKHTGLHITRTYYVRPLKYFGDKLKHIVPTIKKITIVAGSHFDIPIHKSSIYIASILKFFQNNGFDVELRLGKPPDDDFVYMCNAKFFIPSGGGYSNLVKNIVEKFGNTVY